MPLRFLIVNQRRKEILMKAIRFIIIGFALGIALGAINHTALAQKEVKLIGVEEGVFNDHLSAAIIGDSVIIGSREAGTGTIYANDRGDWEKIVDLRANDHNAENPPYPSFGWAVSIGAPHDRAAANAAIIGAPTHGREGGVLVAQGNGAAYIFRRSGRNWKQEIKLVHPDAADDDQFGSAVSLYRNTAVIGVSKDDDSGKNSGSAFVYVRDLERNTWDMQAKLVPQDLGGSDAFGEVAEIYDRTVVVGAPKHTHNKLRFAGAAYVFVREGDTWVEQAKLLPDDAAKAANFGTSVSLTGDTIIVGAPLHDTERGKDAGAAYVFVREGNRWRQEAKLLAADTEKGDRFGHAVATTGNSAIVGAPFRHEGEQGSGAIYSFVNVNGVWQEKAKAKPENPEPKINYGSWVVMNGDLVVVSSHNKRRDGAGNAHGTAAYVYNSVQDLGTLPFAVDPSGLSVTTLGRVKRTALLQNFPNPFNPETWLPYRLGADAPVTLRIYNVRGQLTRELDLGAQKAGSYLTRETAAHWDGRDEVGETVSSGVYFYSLQAGSFQDTRRMLVVK